MEAYPNGRISRLPRRPKDRLGRGWHDYFQLMARCMSSSRLATSAALSAEEPVEELLQAVELALLDVTTGFESISEDGRTRTVH